MLQPLAGDYKTIKVSGATVREIVRNLTAAYPALGDRLLDKGQLRSNISVAIDGEISTLGLLDTVESDSEVHFIPALSGGLRRTDADSLG